MSEKNFFIESAFGEIYEGTFFADDFPKSSKKDSKKNRDYSTVDAQISEATSKVHMPNDVEVSQQVTGKLNSMYALNGNLGSISVMSAPTFNVAILSGI